MQTMTLKKFSLFSLILGIIVAVLGFIFFSISGIYYNNEWWLVGFFVFFGHQSIGLVGIAVIAYIAHFFYKGPIHKIAQVTGMGICIMIAVSPVVFMSIQYAGQKKLNAENAARWAQENTPEKLQAEQERLIEENRKANCDLYEESISNWKEGESRLMKPNDCP